MVEAGGRVPRWKHTLYEWLKVSKAELAVLIELLLRGPQTEGELRTRVNRMESLPDLAALQTILEALMPRGLVVYLSPPGQRRGVMLTHGLYPPEELEKVRLAFAATAAAAGGDEEAPARVSAARGELSAGHVAGLGHRDRRGSRRGRGAAKPARDPRCRFAQTQVRARSLIA